MKLFLALLVSSAFVLRAAQVETPAVAGHSTRPSPTPTAFPAVSVERCGVSLTLPPGWKAEAPEPAVTGCAFGLLPDDYTAFSAQSDLDRDAFPIRVVVFSTGIDDAASQGGFYTRDEQWYVTGRAGSEAATTRISGKGWYGISGTPSIGIHYRTGGNAGLGDTRRVLVVGPHGHCAVLDVSVLEYLQAFDQVLPSLRFVEAPVSR